MALFSVMIFDVNLGFIIDLIDVVLVLLCGLSVESIGRAFCLVGGKLDLAQVEEAHDFGDRKTNYRSLIEKVGGNQVRVLSFMSSVWIKNNTKCRKMVDQKISIE